MTVVATRAHEDTMTEDQDPIADDPLRTPARAWATRAHELIEEHGTTALAELLSEEFEQESRRGPGLRVDAPRLLGTAKTMRSFGMHVSGSTVALAGSWCVLTRRRYHRRDEEVELLAVSVWNPEGKLERLIEFDADALDEALSVLAEVSGEPVLRIPDDD